MTLSTTPLGFQKPDDNEPVRNGNEVISVNAQRAQELLSDTRSRLSQAEAAVASQGLVGPGLIEDPDEPGTYIYNQARVSEDPTDPGFYQIGA